MISIKVYIQYCFVLVSGVQHSGQTLIYVTKWCPQYAQHPPGAVHSYYNITDCIPYAVLYVPVTILQLQICTS